MPSLEGIALQRNKEERNGTSFLSSHYPLPADNATPCIRPFSLHPRLTPRGKRQPPFPVAALAPCWPALERLQLRHLTPHLGKQVSVSPPSALALASDLPALPLPASFPKLAQNTHFGEAEASLEKPNGWGFSASIRKKSAQVFENLLSYFSESPFS